MATFISDRDENDIAVSKELIKKVQDAPWGSLSTSEQNTYLNALSAYEDKGRFGIASADRIKAYLTEITARDTSFIPWGSKDFRGAYDVVIGTPTYFPINREHLKAWVDILKVAYRGNPVNWDFDTKPYLSYVTLNRLESLSKAYYNGEVVTVALDCGTFYTSDDSFDYDTFYVYA